MQNIIRVKVDRIVDEAIDIKSFRFKTSEGGDFPCWTAGAHIDVIIDDINTRQYSLCGQLDDRASYTIAVKLDSGSRGGSRAMHALVLEGSELLISPPRNAFPLCKDASEHILLAGGIGITPLLSMARNLAEKPQKFHLHYFIRSLEHAAFADAIRNELPQGTFTFHVGQDGVQVCTTLTSMLKDRQRGAHLYLCGPRPFMDVALEIASESWPSEALHLEHFSASQEQAVDGRNFIVRLARSGVEVKVPSDKSIVSALADHDIYIDTSCEQGVCGTCVVDVIEGIPDHRDDVLSDIEKKSYKKIALCVSRSLTPILLLDI